MKVLQRGGDVTARRRALLRISNWWRIIACLLIGLLFSGCGGGGGGSGSDNVGDSNSSGGTSRTLIGLSVVPQTLSMYTDEYGYLSVVATYSDQSTESVVTGVTWQIADENVARIIVTQNQAGKVIPWPEGGTTQATAHYQGLTASATVVIEKRFVGIDVRPDKLYLPKYFVGQFTSHALYSGPYYPEDVTEATAWTVGSSEIASVTAQGEDAGTVYAIKPGETTVTGSYRGESASGLLKVMDVDVLGVGPYIDYPIPEGVTDAKVSEAGETFIAWLANDGLYTSGYDAQRRFIPAEKALSLPIDYTRHSPKCAFNSSGKKIVAWYNGEAFYYSIGMPGQPFTTPVMIPGSFDNDSPYRELIALHLNEDGAAYLLWRQRYVIKESILRTGSSVWEAPIQIANDTLMTQASISGEYSPEGQAVASWLSYTSSSTTNVKVQAARTRMVAGTRSWIAPQVVSGQIASLHSPAVGINDNGKTYVMWLEFGSSDDLIRWTTSDMSGLWAASTLLTTGNSHQPGGLVFHIDSDGDGVVAWRDNNAFSVHASLLSSVQGWLPAQQLRPGFQGHPTISEPHINQNGRIKLIWSTSDGNSEHDFETMTHMTGSGWSNLDFIEYPSKVGYANNDILPRFNSSGIGVVIWRDSVSIVGDDGLYFSSYTFSTNYDY